MNKKQYQLLSKLRSLKTKRIKEYKRLVRANKYIEDQHEWDDMMRCEGVLDGIRIGLSTLEEFIKAGDEV